MLLFTMSDQNGFRAEGVEMKSRKYSSDPLIPEYEGPLGRPKMSYEAQRGYDSFYQQKKRSKVFYTPRQFVHWWLENIKTL